MAKNRSSQETARGDANFGDYYIDDEKYRELEKCKVQAGDVLVSLVGTYGKTMIVPEEHEPGIINPRLVKITLDRQKMTPEFLVNVFTQEQTVAQMQSVSHGGTMNILGMQTLKQLADSCATSRDATSYRRRDRGRAGDGVDQPRADRADGTAHPSHYRASVGKLGHIGQIDRNWLDIGPLATEPRPQLIGQIPLNIRLLISGLHQSPRHSQVALTPTGVCPDVVPVLADSPPDVSPPPYETLSIGHTKRVLDDSTGSSLTIGYGMTHFGGPSLGTGDKDATRTHKGVPTHDLSILSRVQWTAMPRLRHTPLIAQL